MPEVLLKAENITKRYPGVLALDRVCFELRSGEVHVLFGENGAGKSTLTKVLAGSCLPDEGTLTLKGRPVAFRSPFDARMQGISAVYQEFSLVPQLTVAENLFLGQEVMKSGFLDLGTMMKAARKSLQDLGFDLDPTRRVSDLQRSERQMTEIAKAIQQKMSVLILDEPTASLTDREVNCLFDVIGRLKREGVGIIYISHRIDELRKIGDRITVLRDGRYVKTLDMHDADEQTLITLMTGRQYEDIYPAINHGLGDVVVSVEDLSTVTGLRDVSFSVRRGEILGIAGLVGAGKSRVGRAIFGLEPITGGRVMLEGTELTKIQPADSIQRGILYFPPDRHKEGLVLCRPVRENQTLASVPLFEKYGFIDGNREISFAKKLVEKMNIRPGRIDKVVQYLSGGNQQKVMLSRGLTRDFKVYVFDEASCGIDIGAKREVYLFLKERAEQGAAVIFISSELTEILHLCHTILVMHGGTICSTMLGSEATEEKILSGCFGYDYMELKNGRIGHAADGEL